MRINRKALNNLTPIGNMTHLENRADIRGQFT
jgi:hypothetical protein